MRRRPPPTVIAYIVLVAAIVVAALVDSGADARVLALGLWCVPSLVALYLRVRLAWIGVTAFQGVNLVAAIVAGAPLWVFAGLIALLALLLSPPTRRYFRRDPNRVRQQGSLLRRALIWGFAAWVLLVAIVLGALVLLQPDPVSGDLGLVHSERHGLRVLFVGNTLTSDNEMPVMLRDLAKGDPGAPPIFAVWYARRGSSLEDALDDERLADLLDDERWFAVVLQENSQVVSNHADRRARTLPAARSLDALGHERGAKTVLFQSGAYRSGDPDLSGDSYAAMQLRLFAGYGALRGRLSAAVAPVGRAYWDAVLRDPSIDLWNDDGLRPSRMGSYLTACVFYAVLTGRDPARSSYTAGLDRGPAKWLAGVAEGAVSERARLG